MKSGLDAVPLFLLDDLLSQTLTTDSVLVYVFCTNCQPEIIPPVLHINKNTNNLTFVILTKQADQHYRIGLHILA